ncbi:MAG: AAA family ATPase [Bacteroidales bacterium]|nr:AAA family ATPase [Bacteroidales bacterium]MBN2756354.1 AAA family ATPase [Bacteroidales bacterium]
MNKKLTGVVDIPLKSQEDDQLQMKSFEMALSEFIKFTSTPITIALQGEWGSGKTSLMNRLEEQLCRAEGTNFYSVWLNTWHYSLMKNDNDILIGIINALIEQVIEISRKEHPEKLKHIIKDVYKVGKTIFKGLSQVAVKTTVSQINENAADSINDVFFNENGEDNYSLNDLRNKLSELINNNIEKNVDKGINKKSFVFFIDDLDRIDPILAINILELMKNIFDIDNCIFILAIDYDVVVKGLKGKFGELNEKNEREFRSFFDKIIQLPFQMPLNSYIIDDYIKEKLLSVNIITKEEADN